MLHRPLPEEANVVGNIYGGNILSHIDSAGSMCAQRHSRGLLVTASLDRMNFISPILPGEIMMLHASVNFVGITSMEVGVRVEAENVLTGEVRHAASCYVTFVGVDEEGRPRPLPPLIPETDEDVRRMTDAARRSALRRACRRNTGDGKIASTIPVEVMEGDFALCRLAPNAVLPQLPNGALFSVTRTNEEVSLVVVQDCLDRALPEPVSNQSPDAKVQTGFACLKLVGPLHMGMVGVMAEFSSVLAAAEIPIFALSTFDTDYFLLKRAHLEKALDILRAVGHPVKTLA